jgi:L-ascorbate metabolism protein UlaG (beta-lactamase superfamily)
MDISYLGHASVRVDLDGLGILTDPALETRIGPLRRIVAPVPDAALEGVDVVLVSHLHLDHLDLGSLRRLPLDVIVVVPAGAAGWLRGQGRPNVVELAPGESAPFGGVRVRAVPARHSGFRPPRGPRSIAVGYVLEGRRSLYFAGDTGLFEEMAELAGSIDIALLPVAGWGPTLPPRTHLDPIRAARAAALVQAPTIVPIHWGTYRPIGLNRAMGRRPGEPVHALLRVAAELAPGSRVAPIEIGERLRIP